MKFTKRLIIFIVIFLFTSGVFGEGESDGIEVKILHIFIRADVNEVRFENLWVFQRDKEQAGWKVEIKIDKDAKIKDWSGPRDGNVLKASLEDGSRIDSVGFTYFKRNQQGSCEVCVSSNYTIKSMVIYLSGTQSRIESDRLVYNDYMSARSRYSHVYTMSGIHRGERSRFNIEGLPVRGSYIIEIITICSLVLIVIIGLITLYYSRKSIKK